jgi:hypothetical protein
VVVQPSVYGTDNACTVDAVRRITAEQIRGLNWHVQVYTRTSVIAALKDHLARMPFPVVIDHFGRGNPAQVPAQPDFAALLDLVRSGAVYVKISGAYRISDKAPDFAGRDALGAGAGRGQSRPDRVGRRLAASEFRLRARQAVDGNLPTVSHRRRSAPQPVAEMGAGGGCA